RADAETNDARWSEVQARLAGVERAAKRLTDELEGLKRGGVAPAEAAAPPVVERPVEVPKPAAVPPAPAPPPIAVSPPVPSQPVASPLPPKPATPPTREMPRQAPLQPQMSPVAAPSFATLNAAEPGTSKRQRAFDIEETLGATWLNKIGIVIVVLGVAF